jgi:gamma-glutamylaminecyclotransferase
MTLTANGKHRIFICGSALRGQPNHENLGDAVFIRTVKTQPYYCLYAAENGWHPAIYKVESEGGDGGVKMGGIAIPGEEYELSVEDYDYLVANEPPHMYPCDIVTEDGAFLTAFLYPKELIEKFNWPDISSYGGWAAYKAAS